MNWNNKEVVLEAVKNRGWALKFASNRIKKDNKFLLELLELCSINLYDLILEKV